MFIDKISESADAEKLYANINSHVTEQSRTKSNDELTYERIKECVRNHESNPYIPSTLNSDRFAEQNILFNSLIYVITGNNPSVDITEYKIDPSIKLNMPREEDTLDYCLYTAYNAYVEKFDYVLSYKNLVHFFVDYLTNAAYLTKIRSLFPSVNGHDTGDCRRDLDKMMHFIMYCGFGDYRPYIHYDIMSVSAVNSATKMGIPRVNIYSKTTPPLTLDDISTFLSHFKRTSKYSVDGGALNVLPKEVCDELFNLQGIEEWYASNEASTNTVQKNKVDYYTIELSYLMHLVIKMFYSYITPTPVSALINLNVGMNKKNGNEYTNDTVIKVDNRINDIVISNIYTTDSVKKYSKNVKIEYEPTNEFDMDGDVDNIKYVLTYASRYVNVDVSGENNIVEREYISATHPHPVTMNFISQAINLCKRGIYFSAIILCKYLNSVSNKIRKANKEMSYSSEAFLLRSLYGGDGGGDGSGDGELVESVTDETHIDEPVETHIDEPVETHIDEPVAFTTAFEPSTTTSTTSTITSGISSSMNGLRQTCSNISHRIGFMNIILLLLLIALVIYFVKNLTGKPKNKVKNSKTTTETTHPQLTPTNILSLTRVPSASTREKFINPYHVFKY